MCVWVWHSLTFPRMNWLTPVVLRCVSVNGCLSFKCWPSVEPGSLPGVACILAKAAGISSSNPRHMTLQGKKKMARKWMDGKKAEKEQKYRKNKGLSITSISDIMHQGLANKRQPSPQLQHVTVDFMRFFLQPDMAFRCKFIFKMQFKTVFSLELCLLSFSWMRLFHCLI